MRLTPGPRTRNAFAILDCRSDVIDEYSLAKWQPMVRPSPGRKGAHVTIAEIPDAYSERQATRQALCDRHEAAPRFVGAARRVVLGRAGRDSRNHRAEWRRQDHAAEDSLARDAAHRGSRGRPRTRGPPARAWRWIST